MTQPPPPEPGPAEDPARDSGLSGGSVSGGGPQSAGGARDRRLAGFVEDGPGDTSPPGAALAAVVADLSGPEHRCDGATDEELIGLLGRWDALEAWAAAGKLGVVRELIRRRARPGPGGYLPRHGDLPDQWHQGLEHEVSLVLGLSIRGADKLTCFAWDLGARLPGIGAALAAGTISEWKATLISDELAVLDDERAAEAEKLILDQVAGQPPGAVGRLAAQAACTVDPAGAAKRREHAEREQARVRFWRANGGACALAAYGLPTDAALAANGAIETAPSATRNSRSAPARSWTSCGYWRSWTSSTAPPCRPASPRPAPTPPRRTTLPRPATAPPAKTARTAPPAARTRLAIPVRPARTGTPATGTPTSATTTGPTMTLTTPAGLATMR